MVEPLGESGLNPAISISSRSFTETSEFLYIPKGTTFSLIRDGIALLLMNVNALALNLCQLSALGFMLKSPCDPAVLVNAAHF